MHISRQHSLGRDEVRRRVESLAESLAATYNLSTEWQADDLKFAGSGFSGCISVNEDTISIDAELGFALKMLEPTIRNSVESALDDHLA